MKLGPCTMIVGPHIFDVVLYGVKPQPAQRGPSPLPQSTPKPAIHPRPSGEQPAPKQSITPRPSAEQPPPKQSITPHPSAEQLAPKQSVTPRPLGDSMPYKLPPMKTTPIQNTPATPQWPGISGTPSSARPLTPKVPQPRYPPQQPPPPPTHRTLQPSPHQKHSQPSHPTLPPPETKPDPIIEMLAAKAATDLGLKELMKTVAAGLANAEELRVFQEHIDGLRKLAQSRSQQYEPPPPHREPIPRPTPGPTLAPIQSSAPTHQLPVVRKLHPTGRESGSHLPSNPANDSRSNTPLRGRAVKQEHAGVFRNHSPSVTQRSRSERPSPFAHSDLTAVVFEYATGSSDRYLFPKHSILDFNSDRTNVLASFLVDRLGLESKSENHEPKHRYYELVTIQLQAATAKILDPLTRVVANAADTKKRMGEMMETTTRVEREYLALRLPRDPEAKDERQQTTKNQGRGMQSPSWDFWTPPGSLRPIVS